jgi:Zn-dependent protease with chaperone function
VAEQQPGFVFAPATDMSAPMSSRYIHAVAAGMLGLTLVTASAQTKIVAPKTKYSVAEDVKVGQEAAAEARKQLPLLNDERVDQYVEGVGAKLAAAIPSEFQHPEFMYTFDVVNQKEINAFALPGGPMFLNRGMMEAAKTEAEMAGVMAHELSHVALRHGTAQATKSTPWQIGSVLGQIGGAILGGTAGSILGQTSQIVPGVVVLKYGREAETQADLLGAQILARAGYDPLEMANMFKTIEAQGGGGGPEWLSSHPNPGNRYNAITKEAAALQVQGKADTGQFSAIQARLKDAGPSFTAEQIAQGKAKTGNSPSDTAGRPAGGRVEPPSPQSTPYTPARFLRVAVPSNWNAVGKDGATYTPQGAYFEAQNAFTHGIQFGVTQGTGNLQRDTESLLKGFARSNPQLRQQTTLRRDSIDGRSALSTTLSNVSDITGQAEVITFTTAALPDGNVLYMIGVAPQTEAASYDPAFRRVKQSVRIAAR